jgi:CubicO group peptidase (beta-lactamase class C family)
VAKGVEIFSHEELVHVPGTAYLYTSQGYSLLSAVIEVVTGVTFDTFMQREVFCHY